MYLIDSHILLWYLEDAGCLSPKIRSLLKSQPEKVIVSVVTIWELLLKKHKGKLECPNNLTEVIALSGFEVLPIRAPHVERAVSLPNLHADPFDRLLIAQALTEKHCIITVDEVILRYHVPSMPT